MTVGAPKDGARRRAAAALPRRALGDTGIEVSVIGLGTAKLGRAAGLKVAPFALPSMRQARRLLDAAAAAGVCLIDTAPAYGTSEARLGELLAGRRGNWVLSTKAGERFNGRGSRFDYSFAAITASIDASLKRLKTDFLDIVFVHSNGADGDILRRGEAVGALDAAKRAGKVLATGFSHKTVAGGRLALSHCDAIMATLSRRRRGELDLVREAGAAGRGVLVKKALDSGAAAPESLGWVVRQTGVASVLVGTIDADHLAEDVAAAGDGPCRGRGNATAG